MVQGTEPPIWDILVVGGGAAGYFAAITAAEQAPGLQIGILERGKDVLEKVRISGGGRCNVTHACFDPKELILNYPRGSRELLGPFMRFGPADTIEWFKGRGVQLKTEADGRMFPRTDNSDTIVQCLLQSARNAGIRLFTGSRLEQIQAPAGTEDTWRLLVSGKWLVARRVLIATGSSPAVWKLLGHLGLSMVDPVPSLFTFNIKDPRLSGLAGVSVPKAAVRVEGDAALIAEGPLLVTHWGLSGPAILRLSAWGALRMAEWAYQFTIRIQWLPGEKRDLDLWIRQQRESAPRKLVMNTAPAVLPARLWERFVQAAGIPPSRYWAELKKEEANELIGQCLNSCFSVSGKSTFKDEFVTAGGVNLKEIDFRSFSARRIPGLFLAGEVLNIDAITGGFNFQAAWTGGYLAGQALAQGLTPRSVG
jgi:predicted Rossmann fold flavoprotein